MRPHSPWHSSRPGKQPRCARLVCRLPQNAPRTLDAGEKVILPVCLSYSHFFLGLLQFLYGIANAEDPRLDNFCVDTTQMEMLSFRRVDKLQRFQPEPC